MGPFVPKLLLPGGLGLLVPSLVSNMRPKLFARAKSFGLSQYGSLDRTSAGWSGNLGDAMRGDLVECLDRHCSDTHLAWVHP